MRGLPFPSIAAFDRETSYEYGTPVNDIPIDPALSTVESVIDPAIMGASGGVIQGQGVHPGYPFPEQQLRPHSRDPRHYSQGPQGDPFAPQPTPFLPIEAEVLQPTPKPVKRRRRPPREEECGFCGGNEQNNKNKEPEVMVTCSECGRSGHPSCMELGEIGEVMRSYPWKCTECKICEICQEKGDDERILFCDFCDRGWHMDCLQPPLEESPPGKWHCPMCPPLILDSILYPPEPVLQPEAEPSPPKQNNNSEAPSDLRGAVISTNDSDADEDDTPTTAKRTRRKSRKGRAQAGSDTDEARPTSPLRVIKRMRLRVHSPAPPRMVVRLKLPAKGKGKERDEEEKGMFDDILSVDERDTTKTGVEYGDKQRFDKSRFAAEEKLAPPPPPPAPDIPETPIAGPSSRPLRSSALQLSTPALATKRSTSPTPSTPVHLSDPTALRIRSIRFGQYDIQTWYDAPFPEEYATIPDGRLWICEFCLKYMKSRFGAMRHRMKCKARHPPGDEIYRDGTVSIFEVDGRKNKIYCQNLCLLSKMFLDHKSLFYDVEPFLFYVMTEVDDVGARFVGYFSKEKRSPKDYNVSCIMTLPVRQRKGWGNLLIDFSYLLSKKEQRAGSPEKPLSDLGALGYKNYWTLAIMRYLETAPDNPRLEDISAATSMTIEDIHAVLVQQHFLNLRERTPQVRPSPGQSIKFPKGRKNGIARRNLQRTQTQDEENSSKSPFVPPSKYEIRWDREKVDQYLRAWEAKDRLCLKPEKLKWSPFLLARTKKTEALDASPIESTEGKDGPSEPTSADETAKVVQDLFADGDVNVVPAADTSEKQDPPVATSPPSVDHDVAQLEKDRALAEELASPAKRRLRSHSQSATHGNPSTPTPIREKFKSKDTATPEPVSTRRTRSDSSRVPEKGQKLVDAADNDEALATKLALEEKRPTRQLRSRTEIAPGLKRMTRTSSSKASSPRKRRRVESSPEADESSPPATVSSVHPKEGLPCAEIIVAEQPDPQKLVQLVSRSGLVQGTTGESLTLIIGNGHVPINSLNNSPTTIVVNINSSQNRGQSEVKSEDLGTPLTGLTGPNSRHSVPSDDTIAADTNNWGGGKDTDIHSRGADVLHHPRMVGDVGGDECEDIDAEGEDDAEGDLDVDLEV